MINRTRYESDDLDKNQNEAARIVSGATKLASILSGRAVAQWLSAWLETKGPRVRASPASLLMGRKESNQNPFFPFRKGLDFALMILL